MWFTSVDFFLNITDVEAHQILCAFLDSNLECVLSKKKPHDEMFYILFLLLNR